MKPILTIAYDDNGDIKYKLGDKEDSFAEILGALDIARHKILDKCISRTPENIEEPLTKKTKNWLTKKRGKKARAEPVEPQPTNQFEGFE